MALPAGNAPSLGAALVRLSVGRAVQASQGAARERETLQGCAPAGPGKSWPGRCVHASGGGLGGIYGGFVLFLQSCVRVQAMKGVTQGMTAILDPAHIPGVRVAAGRPVRVGLPALRLRGDTQWLSPVQGRCRSGDPAMPLLGAPTGSSGWSAQVLGVATEGRRETAGAPGRRRAQR